MMQTQQKYYSPEEYLVLEEAADYKSEYIDGQIVPMPGGSANHNRITGNVFVALNVAFKTQDFEAFMNDLRLWIPERRIYTYPDVMVVEGEPEYVNDRTDMIINPQVIVEVLSNSTQGYDRTDKFAAYRTIPTFEEYLFFDQTKIYVEQYSKTANKRWSFREYDIEDETISLTSVELEIAIVDIYNKVKFETVTKEN
ncbi:MAG TPA: Uma2 family endonuclease [Candidatus Sericytochromatia bacterium]